MATSTTSTASTTKLISIEIPVSLEYRILWCKAKGYSDKTETFNATTGLQEIINNPETMEQFFERVLKQELLNMAIQPINSLIYQQINKEAEAKIKAINDETNTNLKITLA